MSQYKTITPPKGSLRSPITLTIVDYLLKHGPARLADIDLALMKIDGYCTNTDPARLSRTLNKLREQGHIHRILRNDEMLWAHGPHPQTVDPAAEAEPEPDVVAVVQAPRFDLMRAPLYVPDAGPALRPGALNFKACASVGQRC